jgi:hypothetical protein
MSNANDSAATFNPISVPHNQFTQAVQTLHGEDAELLDAFLYGGFDLDGMPVTFRLGRHALLWGESLYFANNGIAAGQAPIDAIKAQSEPGAEAKELYLPVGQISATIEPFSGVDLSFYYQFEWEETRLPGSGSYFSEADFLDAGGERLIIQPGEYLYRARDRNPPASGQFGVALQSSLGEFDYGFYALRYNAKQPELYLLPGIAAGPNNTIYVVDPSIVDLSVGRVGDYQLVYPKGIDVFGASFSTYLGDNAIAGEISTRRNMPLVSGYVGLPAIVVGGYGGGSYAAIRRPGAPLQGPPLVAIAPDTVYPTGETLHAQLSDVTILPPGQLWDGAQFSVELAANDLLKTTSNAFWLDPSRTRFAASFRTVLEPQYFEVLPSLDVTTPIGIGYNLVGRSSIDGSQNAGVGDVEFGIGATYRAVWTGNITLTHYLGNASRQPLADRDFVSISLQRTF